MVTLESLDRVAVPKLRHTHLDRYVVASQQTPYDHLILVGNFRSLIDPRSCVGCTRPRPKEDL
jgi:hypothetical protein